MKFLCQLSLEESLGNKIIIGSLSCGGTLYENLLNYCSMKSMYPTFHYFLLSRFLGLQVKSYEKLTRGAKSQNMYGFS